MHKHGRIGTVVERKGNERTGNMISCDIQK